MPDTPPHDLPWPPEGLEPLRGNLDRAGRQLVLSTTVTALLTLRLVSRGSEGTQLLDVDATALVIASLVLSALWLMLSIDFVRWVCSRTARGLRAGFGWITLLEVASDPRGTTGNLIVGRGAAAALDPALRRNLRVARVVAALAPLSAGLLALVVFLVRLRFADSETSDTATGMVVIALALAGIGTQAAMRWFERSHLPGDAPSRRMPAVSVLRPRAESWTEALGRVADTDALGSGGNKSPLLAHVGHALAVLLAFAAFTVTMVVAIATMAGTVILKMATPRLDNSERRYATLAGLERFTIPADSSVSPLVAGIALATMDYRTDVRPSVFSLRDRAPLPTPPWLDSAPPGLGADARNVSRPAAPWIDSVRRRLTPAELAWMRRVVEYPGWEYARTVARAPRVDIIGGRFELPFADSANLIEMPIAPISVFRDYANANAWRVRYYLEVNKPDSAVYAARELLTLSLRVTQDARWIIDAFIGVRMAQQAQDQLERTYAVLRDPQRDTLLRVSRDAAVRAATSTRVSFAWPDDPARIAARWRQLANDTDRMRATRWEVASLLGLAVCTDARSLLRGPSQEVREALDTFLAREAIWASDSAVVDAIRAGPLRGLSETPRADESVSFRVVRATGALLGTPYIAACLRFMNSGYL